MAASGIDKYTAGSGVQGGYIDHISTGFDNGLATLRDNLDAAHKALAGDGQTAGDPGNPYQLASYQKASAEYQLYRNAQSSAVKMYKDLAQGTISKWN